MLAQHLARQQLVRQLLQQEKAVMQQVQATAAAARADAELVLQTTLDRLPGYNAQQQQQQRRQQQEEEQQAAAAGGTSPEAGTAAAAAGPDPVATAEQLLACREQLQRLSAAVHGDTLPAQRAVFAQLHALLYRSSSSASSSSSSSGAAAGQPQQPELSGPELQAQLAAVAAAHGAFLGQAIALLTEIQERQAAPEQRHLAEQVLVDFWSRPGRLGAVAAQQREALEKFV